MDKRTLVLRKETLAELTTGELRGVVAGLSDLATCTVTADALTCLPPTMTMCPDFYCSGTC